MVWAPSIAAGGAFVIVSVVKTWLRWLGGERETRDVWGRRSACHDFLVMREVRLWDDATEHVCR